MICSSNIFFNQYKMMTNTQQGGSIHEGTCFFFQTVETKFKASVTPNNYWSFDEDSSSLSKALLLLSSLKLKTRWTKCVTSLLSVQACIPLKSLLLPLNPACIAHVLGTAASLSRLSPSDIYFLHFPA